MAAAPSPVDAAAVLLPYVKRRLAEGLEPLAAVEVAIEDLAESVERGKYWLSEIENNTEIGRAAYVRLAQCLWEQARTAKAI